MCSHSLGSDRATTATTGSLVAEVEDLVRHAGLDENQISGGIVDRLSEMVAVFVADPALEDVQHHLEADVDMGEGDAAGWNRGDVHRELFGPDVLARQPRFVLDPIPAADVRAGTNHEDPLVSFHLAQRVLVGIGHRITCRG